MSETNNEFEKVETNEQVSASPSSDDSTVKSNPSEGTGVENLLEGDAEKFEQVNTGEDSFKIDWSASPKSDSGLKSDSTASNNAKTKAMTTLLNADVILWGADTILSRLGVFISGMTGNKSTKEDWQLDAKEKAEIKPILEATIKEENWSHIPAKYILIGVVLVIYATKIQMVNDREKLRKIKEEKIKPEKLEKDLEEVMERVSKNEVFEESDYPEVAPEEKINDLPTERKRVLLEIRKRLLTESGFIFDKSKLPFTPTQDEIDYLLEGIKGYTKFGTKIGRPSKKGKNDIEDADFVLVNNNSVRFAPSGTFILISSRMDRIQGRRSGVR